MKSGVSEDSIESFLDTVAAKTSTPGGGAVAAITGAQAAALISMVCSFSPHVEGVTQIQSRVQEARVSFLALATTDIEAFNKLMVALRRPENEAGRLDNIQASLKEAAESPREMMVLVDSMIDDALVLLRTGNKNLVTDSTMAAILIAATIRSAELNILINLKSIGDKNYRTTVNTQTAECIARSKKLTEAADRIRNSLQID
tara:strand:- start:800 stop:1405 length:606 start_codon:yes stop_codon:yes gene_type:complete